MLNRFRVVSLFLVFCLFLTKAGAQDTLPEFSVKIRPGGKPVISWHNTYPVIRQLTIQRSMDGRTAYKSILTLPDPSLPENGFMDVSAPHDKWYYRLYILLDSGQYLFSRPKQAVLDTSAGPADGPREGNVSAAEKTLIGKSIPPNAGLPIYVKIRDSLAGVISDQNLKKFRDSIAYNTKDTIVFITKDTLQIKPFVPKEVFRPSLYVFTSKDGNVQLELPSNKAAYRILFFEYDTNEMLLEMDDVPSGSLTLDKANFFKSGWYWFELYEGEKLKERHKFYIPKEF